MYCHHYRIILLSFFSVPNHRTMGYGHHFDHHPHQTRKYQHQVSNRLIRAIWHIPDCTLSVFLDILEAKSIAKFAKTN